MFFHTHTAQTDKDTVKPTIMTGITRLSESKGGMPLNFCIVSIDITVINIATTDRSPQPAVIADNRMAHFCGGVMALILRLEKIGAGNAVMRINPLTPSAMSQNAF